MNKLEILLLKIKEDGRVTPTEYENGMMNSKSEIKSKDVKKVEKMAKKGIASAAFKSTLRKDASRDLQHIIFCCPIIVSLNREPEQHRLTPTAPPPYEL